MPEVDAFYAFSRFVTKKFPLYWISAHIGAHAGCVLVDKILAVVDPDLHGHLIKYKLPSAYLYAFSSVSSLSASAPPFKELLKLWDFLITFGPHFNILCVVAQVISLRDRILKTEQPEQILNYRKWPRLRAKFIISVAMSLLPQLPTDIYDQMCNHGTDSAVASLLTGREFSIHNTNSNNSNNNSDNDSPRSHSSFITNISTVNSNNTNGNNLPSPSSMHGTVGSSLPSLTIGGTASSTPSTISQTAPLSPKQLSLAPPNSISPSTSPSISPVPSVSLSASTPSTTLSSSVPRTPVSPRNSTTSAKHPALAFTIPS
jgi:hypothetical protein